jgi:hypothetical protein
VDQPVHSYNKCLYLDTTIASPCKTPKKVHVPSIHIFEPPSLQLYHLPPPLTVLLLRLLSLRSLSLSPLALSVPSPTGTATTPGLPPGVASNRYGPGLSPTTFRLVIEARRAMRWASEGERDALADLGRRGVDCVGVRCKFAWVGEGVDVGEGEGEGDEGRVRRYTPRNQSG